MLFLAANLCRAVLTFVPVGHFVEFRAVDCSDNTDNYISPSISTLNITCMTTTENITKCEQLRIYCTHDGYMQSFLTDCVVLPSPRDSGVNVSESVVDSTQQMLTEEMGSLKSRFATQFMACF